MSGCLKNGRSSMQFQKLAPDDIIEYLHVLPNMNFTQIQARNTQKMRYSHYLSMHGVSIELASLERVSNATDVLILMGFETESMILVWC